MKVTELMIGDYVKYQGHIYIVEEISAKGWVHLIHPETKARLNLASDYIIDLLEPIPLTPEFFERIGFKVDLYAIFNLQDGKWLEYYFHEHRFSMYCEVIDEWQNHSRVRDILHRSYPFYANELQHCLRQCGLNDLADNFKLEG